MDSTDKVVLWSVIILCITLITCVLIIQLTQQPTQSTTTVTLEKKEAQ